MIDIDEACVNLLNSVLKDLKPIKASTLSLKLPIKNLEGIIETERLNSNLILRAEGDKIFVTMLGLISTVFKVHNPHKFLGIEADEKGYVKKWVIFKPKETEGV